MNKTEYGYWMALQPIEGKDRTFDRGSIFQVHKPWTITDRNDWVEKPYLTISPIEDINTVHPYVYTFDSPVFKLFETIKNEKNWFRKLCDHDLDFHCKENYAQCRKCDKVIATHPNNPQKLEGGCYIVNSYADEALSFRGQFGGFLE